MTLLTVKEVEQLISGIVKKITEDIGEDNGVNDQIKAFADDAAEYSATMALITGKNGDELFLSEFAELIRADEREACAKQASELAEIGYDGRAIAIAIKARGEVK